MEKKLLVAVSMAFSSLFCAQVGIFTPSPQGVFHIDGGKDNPTKDAPSASQQANDFILTAQKGIGTGTISMGLGTTAPTQRIDVVNGTIRLRTVASSVGNSSDRLLVADSNGVIKVAGGDAYSVENSGNRVLDAQGGASINASSDWSDNDFTTLTLNEAYDPTNAYNPSTGVFTVPTDGLYTMYGVTGFNTPKDGSGVFDGTSGTAFTALFVDGARVATNHNVIYRGAKNPSSDPTRANLFFLVSNATIWMKAGQKVTLQFMTYGTSNMVGNLSDLQISKDYSHLIINKIL